MTATPFSGRTAASLALSLITLFTAIVIAMGPVSLLEAEAAEQSLSWTAPTTYQDGTEVTEIAGYKLYTGSASGSYQQSVDVGNRTSHTVSGLSDGATYYFAVTAYDTAGVESAFSNEWSRSFPSAQLTHLITATSGHGGTITALSNANVNQAASGTTTVSSVAVNDGANQDFSIAASAGYGIVDVAVDGTSVGAVTSYSFTAVATDHTISATFAPGSCTITASAGPGGSITPPGTSTVDYGASKSYTITAASGYRIADVKVDGVSVGAVNSYSFANVTASHTIVANFTVNSFSISASGDVNGAISPAGTTTVSYGGNQTFTMVPAAGYHVAAVTVDGTSVGAVSSYTFSNVTSNHSIKVSFAIDTHKVTASAGTGGSITPSGTVTINHGGSRTFTLSPNRKYRIADVKVDGVSLGAITSYTFSNIQADHSISARFSRR